jgi:hypothetical protein
MRIQYTPDGRRLVVVTGMGTTTMPLSVRREAHRLAAVGGGRRDFARTMWMSRQTDVR